MIKCGFVRHLIRNRFEFCSKVCKEFFQISRAQLCAGVVRTKFRIEAGSQVDGHRVMARLAVAGTGRCSISGTNRRNKVESAERFFFQFDVIHLFHDDTFPESPEFFLIPERFLDRFQRSGDTILPGAGTAEHGFKDNRIMLFPHGCSRCTAVGSVVVPVRKVRIQISVECASGQRILRTKTDFRKSIRKHFGVDRIDHFQFTRIITHRHVQSAHQDHQTAIHGIHFRG